MVSIRKAETTCACGELGDKRLFAWLGGLSSESEYCKGKKGAYFEKSSGKREILYSYVHSVHKQLSKPESFVKG